MTDKRLPLYFFAVLLIAILVVTFLIFFLYLDPLVLGLALAIIFHPLHRGVRRYIKQRSLASLVSTVIVILVIFGPVAFFAERVFSEAQSLYLSLAENSSEFNRTFQALISPYSALLPNISLNLDTMIQQGFLLISSNIGSFFTSVLQVAFTVLLSLVCLYYLFRDGHALKKALIRISPLPDHYDEEILTKLQHTVSSVIRGTLLIALIQGTLAAIGFTLFGVPNGALWGSVASISALIPGVGTALVVGPAVAYLFLSGSFNNAIGLLIWGALGIGLIDNFLSPGLLSRGVNVHPFLIFIAVLGGIQLFGLIGFIIGPVVLSLLFALLEIYQVLIKDNIPAKESTHDNT